MNSLTKPVGLRGVFFLHISDLLYDLLTCAQAMPIDKLSMDICLTREALRNMLGNNLANVKQSIKLRTQLLSR